MRVATISTLSVLVALLLAYFGLGSSGRRRSRSRTASSKKTAGAALAGARRQRGSPTTGTSNSVRPHQRLAGPFSGFSAKR